MFRYNQVIILFQKQLIVACCIFEGDCCTSEAYPFPPIHHIIICMSILELHGLYIILLMCSLVLWLEVIWFLCWNAWLFPVLKFPNQGWSREWHNNEHEENSPNNAPLLCDFLSVKQLHDLRGFIKLQKRSYQLPWQFMCKYFSFFVVCIIL